MKQKSKRMAQAGLIAALYAVVCYLQNLIFPDSGSMAVQLRAAEALCILAFFTPAAVPGLAMGCLVFNIGSGAALPLDFLLGPLATVLTAGSMWLCRKYPYPALLFPALYNGIIIGWELSAYIGGGFWLNAGLVAAGETIVLLTLGLGLYTVIRVRKMHRLL